jgi:FKBP-type peptidyl-prolyl cis-trans isomerase FkpA
MTKISKNYLFSLIYNLATAILFGFMLTSCLGEDPFEKQRKADESTIRAYVATQKLQGNFTASGLYYDTITNDPIKNQRVVRVTENSIVQISYKLTDLQGIVLQKTDSTHYFFQPSVGAFFSGLAEGILLTRKGQNAIFIVPSLLALGSQARTVNGVSVPPNSCLRLEVTVIDVRNASEQDFYENQLIKNHIAKKMLTITKDSSGVVFVRTFENTTGARFKIGDNVKITYEGRRLDGTTFDKGTLPQNSPDPAPLQGYVKGFMAGITMMRVGEKGYIYVNSSSAYGAAGTAGKIAPFTPLVFEITALSR